MRTFPFLSRLSTATRIAAASSNQLATTGTVVVTFLAKPILEVVLIVAYVAASGGTSLALVAYAGLLVSAVSGIATGVAGSVAVDRGHGVLLEILGRGGSTAVFWVSRLAVPAVLAGAMTSVGLTTIFLLGLVPASLFAAAMALLPVALITGGLLAILVGALAAVMRDPFLAADITVWILPILTGVVAPLTAYPQGFSAWCHCVPGANIISALRQSAAQETTIWLPALRDLASAACLALVGIGLMRLAVHTLRRGHRSEAF